MRIIITLTLVLLTTNTSAIWSGFAHVTPETEDKYELQVEITPVPGQKKLYSIKVKAVDHDHKHAWLISTSRALSRDEQQLRAVIWGDKPLSTDIRLKTRLRPIKADKDYYYKVELDAELVSKSYIYIDFPSMVFDGGYFYSIDLGAYLVRLEKRE